MRAGGALPLCNVYGLGFFPPPAIFFPWLFEVSAVSYKLLFLPWLFFSGSCHVRENGFLLERLIATGVNFLSEKLVYKKRGFVGRHKSKETSKHFSEGIKIIRQMAVGLAFRHGCSRWIREVCSFCWESSEGGCHQRPIAGERMGALQMASQGQLRMLESGDSPSSGWSFSPHQPTNLCWRNSRSQYNGREVL